jgi:hypothetical protein
LLARWELARRHPLSFLRWFAYTCDQHNRDEPVQPFPWRRPHIQHMVGLWLDNPMLAVCKSRQMIQTWFFVAMAVWDWAFHKGRLIMLQSKRLDDAVGDENSGDGLLGRAKFIVNHIPALKLLLPDYKPTGEKMLRESMNSTIWAIPQGSAIIRQRTASGILADEAPFQEEFEDACMASMPCVRNGGWYVALGTPDLRDGGYFKRLVRDEPDPT